MCAQVGGGDTVREPANHGELDPILVADRAERAWLGIAAGNPTRGGAGIIHLIGICCAFHPHADWQSGQVIGFVRLADVIVAVNPGIDQVIAAGGRKGMLARPGKRAPG